jgi:MFS family permease
VVLLGVWGRRSWRHPSPLIDLKLFRLRPVLVANLAMAMVAVSSLQITQLFSLLLQQPVWTGVGLGVTATVAGLVKLPSNLISLGGGPYSGILLRQVGARTTLTIATLIMTAGWLLALFYHNTVLAVGLCLVVISFGTTMVYATLPNIIVDAVPDHRTSEAVGMMMVVRSTFMAAGAQLVAISLGMDTVQDPANSSVHFPSLSAYNNTLLLILLVCAGMVVLARSLARREGGAAMVIDR